LAPQKLISKEDFMKTTTTLERLLNKPLNAKYYPYDQDVAVIQKTKKVSFVTEIAHLIIEVLSIVSNPITPFK
jgi:hypothetical protein